MGTASWSQLTANWAQHNRRLAVLLARRTGTPGKGIVLELERERERIARDLHAGAGQPLSGIQVWLEMVDDFIRNPAGGGHAAAAEAVTRLRWLAGEALQQVRAFSHRLHPPDWQLLSLPEALRHLVDSSGLAQRFHCDIRIEELPAEIPHEVQVVVYRCAQEVIANVIRHSGATQVTLEVTADQDTIVLHIVDNGKGFQPPAAGGGIGLPAMKRHAESLGGQCHIQSSSAGTTISLRIPVAGE